MPQNAVYSCIIRSGKTTYFIDVKEARNGKKYISVSENRLDAESGMNRVTIRVFSQGINQFLQAVSEAASAAR